MFSNFSLNKLTSTITTAAQSAQETINNTILSPNVQTKLQIKKTTRFLQEKVGAIPEDEISKLPKDYQQLELKVDALEKVLHRLLLVTRTFELEGYDYPPNLTESLNHWWNEEDKKVRDFKNGEKESKESENEENKETSNAVDDDSDDKLVEINPSIFNRSFAIAISKAVLDSQQIFVNLKKREEQNSSNDDKTNDEEDEEDDDLNNLIKAFQSWCHCYKNIDQSQNDMNTMIVKEFNQKLSDILAIDFKTVKKLRKKVQESRLEFDTMRHEIKIKNLSKKEAKEELTKAKTESEKELESENKDNVDSKDKTKEDTSMEEQQQQQQQQEEEEEATEEDRLLEQLEDDFVSNITAAAEKMTEITDSVEIISLVKLFQNIQLVHYRQCVQELENSMKLLDTLTINDDDE